MALINYLTQINIDFGTLSLLKAECERVGIQKPLIVTDVGVRAAGVLDKALLALGAMPHAIFDQTPPTRRKLRCARRWRSLKPTVATV
jgi:alcohol dehydrogenase class IV